MSKRLEQLLQMLEANPQESFLKFAIAKEYEKKNLLNEALQYYNTILTNDPDYTGLYYHLGKLYEQLQNEEKALSIYELGIKIARRQGDQHSLSELAAARLDLHED